MLRICADCGALFEGSDADSVVCPECADRIRRESVLRDRVCVTCGRVFPGYPKAKYCPECRIEARRKADRECRQRKAAGTVRPIGSVDRCANCGKEYVVNSGLQRYCPECAEVVVPQNISAHKAERRQNDPSIEQKRSARRKQKISACVVCGQPFPPEASRKNTCSDACRTILHNFEYASYAYRSGRRKSPPSLEHCRDLYWSKHQKDT